MMIDQFYVRVKCAADQKMAPLQIEDALAEDDFADVPVVATRRQLMRLAIASAGVGARFAREDVEHDPVAWMMTPLRAFEGLCALDACLELKGLLRSIVLNAPEANLGFDASPALLDDLLSDDELNDIDLEIHTDGGAADMLDRFVVNERTRR